MHFLDSPSRKVLLSQLLGALSADTLQLIAPLGVFSAADHHLTLIQGQTFPRAIPHPMTNGLLWAQVHLGSCGQVGNFYCPLVHNSEV